ncbi:MAG TPA: DUF3301 domain-containing protein [Xanthomonadales bacterium]|nr:DUF3301 domain-containing protein [Xanthomonadales bacterium]
MIGLILLILAGAIGMCWWQLLHGRERARSVAAAACREHGLVLMDDTVVFDTVSFRPAGPNRLFALVYRFEFAYQGVLHQGGKVLVSPGIATTVLITTANGDLIEEY